ncbi:class I SAM-dependent methyltransferase [Mycolicibacterium sp.]|uniref:class I SAM-dependent methyltransferase n=1 Tax=Mycolicibacterium sp. TaxID=2320850 RepID=UPI003D144F02
MSASEVKQHWEDRYAERDRIWSGRVNAQLARIAAPLPTGRALDLGCGEGGDSLWLAEHGWQVLGVDISETALGRAAAEAEARGLTGRVRFTQIDLSEDFPEGEFDLVSAQFLQSFVHLDRDRIFAAAAEAVAPGGLLVIVDHGAAPPWAPPQVHDHRFPAVEEVFASLGLDESRWEGVCVGTEERDAVGPDGQAGVLLDNVIVVRRLNVGAGG